MLQSVKHRLEPPDLQQHTVSSSRRKLEDVLHWLEQIFVDKFSVQSPSSATDVGLAPAIPAVPPSDEYVQVWSIAWLNGLVVCPLPGLWLAHFTHLHFFFFFKYFFYGKAYPASSSAFQWENTSELDVCGEDEVNCFQAVPGNPMACPAA